MKAKLRPEEIGVNISKITSTNEGNVRIVLSETHKGAKREMVKMIAENVKSASDAHLIRKLKGIVLLDIEDDIDEADVRDALHKILQVESDEIQINPLRPTNRGT